MSFQPVCGLCLSDCDRRGSVTSCLHFLCSRCLSRLPTSAPCPLCRRPCRMIVLDQPEAQPLLQSGTATLEQAARVVGTQLRHYQQINRRMRQALEMLHGQYQSLRRQRDQETAERAAETQKARALEGECRRLREQLSGVHAQARNAAAATAYAQQPPPSRSPSVSSVSSHDRRHGGQPLRPPTPQIAAPLGWAASSHIAKRLYADGGAAPGAAAAASPVPPPPHAQRLSARHDAAGAAGGGAFTPRPADGSGTLGAAFGAPADAMTPRAQAIASLHLPRSPHDAHRAGGRLREETVPPQTHFRLDTPLANALQQRHVVTSPSPASAALAPARPATKPLQRLFASRGAEL